MNKRNSVVIAAILLLLIGSGSFVFANPSEEDLTGTTNGINENHSTNESNQNNNNNNGNNNSSNTIIKDNILDGSTDNSINSDSIDLNSSGTDSNPWAGNSNIYPSGSGSSGSSTNNSSNSSSSETVNPILPEEPIQPVEPVTPNQPENPSKPGETDPTQPDEPSKPEETDPTQPDKPSKPEETDPTQPDKPSKPEETDPTQPDEPSKPGETDPDDESEIIKKAMEYLEQAENSKKQEDIDKAFNEIQKIKNEEKKNELLEKVSSLQELVNLIKIMNQLSQFLQESKSKEDILNIRNLMNQENVVNRIHDLDSSLNEKEELQKMLAGILHVVEDTSVPVIQGLPENDITNQNVSLEIIDDNDVIISLNGTIVTKEDLQKFSDEGTYHILVQDSAFNETEVTFIIDKTAPLVTISYSTKDMTNQDVIVTLNSLEDIIITNNDGKNVYTFTSNGDFTFEFEDLAGNKSSVVAKVENIDKDAPMYQSFTVVNQTRLGTSLDKTVLNPEEEIFVSVSFSEKLQVLPTISIQGVEVMSEFNTELSTSSLYVYTLSYVVHKDEFPDGYLDIFVKDYMDGAGNVGEVLTSDDLDDGYDRLYLINEPGLELINNGAFSTKDITIHEPGFSYMTIYNYRMRETVTIYTNKYTFDSTGTYLITVYNDHDEVLKEATMSYDVTLPTINGVGTNNNIESTLVSGKTYDAVTLNIRDNYAIYNIKRIYEDKKEEILKKYELSSSNVRRDNLTFTESGNYKIVVIDKALNETEIVFTIQ